MSLTQKIKPKSKKIFISMYISFLVKQPFPFMAFLVAFSGQGMYSIEKAFFGLLRVFLGLFIHLD